MGIAKHEELGNDVNNRETYKICIEKKYHWAQFYLTHQIFFEKSKNQQNVKKHTVQLKYKIEQDKMYVRKLLVIREM